MSKRTKSINQPTKQPTNLTYAWIPSLALVKHTPRLIHDLVSIYVSKDTSGPIATPSTVERAFHGRNGPSGPSFSSSSMDLSATSSSVHALSRSQLKTQNSCQSMPEFGEEVSGHMLSSSLGDEKQWTKRYSFTPGEAMNGTTNKRASDIYQFEVDHRTVTRRATWRNAVGKDVDSSPYTMEQPIVNHIQPRDTLKTIDRLLGLGHPIGKMIPESEDPSMTGSLNPRTQQSQSYQRFHDNLYTTDWNNNINMSRTNRYLDNSNGHNIDGGGDKDKGDNMCVIDRRDASKDKSTLTTYREDYEPSNQGNGGVLQYTPNTSHN